MVDIEPVANGDAFDWFPTYPPAAYPNRARRGSALTPMPSEDDDEFMTLSAHNSDCAHTKLEVLTSSQFNRLVLINVLIAFGTFLSVTATATACRTAWKRTETLDLGVADRKFVVNACDPPNSFLKALNIIDTIAQLFLLTFAVVFSVRVLSNKKTPVCAEQYWCVAMVLTTALSYNPLINILNLLKIQTKVISASRAISLFLASAGQLFYVWGCAHSYGIVGDYEALRPSWCVMYFPKVTLLLLYGTWRLVLRFVFKISPSKLPFVSMLAYLANVRVTGLWHAQVLLKIAALTAIELVIVFTITRRIIITARTLREVDYLKYRTKQLGFRYFIMQNCLAFSFFLLADISLLFSIQRDYTLSFLTPKYGIHLLYNFRFGHIVRLMNYSTTVLTAWVCLPPDSKGFRGWFRGTGTGELAKEDREVISLKVKMPKRPFRAHYFSSRFVLDLQVLLFNMASLAYEKKKHDSLPPSSAKLMATRDVTMNYVIHDPGTDTFVIILEHASGIIVTFKGTSSTENLKTDMKMAKVWANEHLPTFEEEHNIDRETQRILNSRTWNTAMVHKGFMEAYRSVSEELLDKLTEMMGTNTNFQIPIYLTGHSLGGALATICSMDLVLSKGWRDIYVSTFGSPRCGNMMWAKLYNDVVPAHWRVAIRSDIVPTMPKMGYAHVGKRVALTSAGDMFLDPNSIETALWSSTVTGVADHRKPAYANSMKLFCSKYLPHYTPEFLASDDNSELESIIINEEEFDMNMSVDFASESERGLRFSGSSSRRTRFSGSSRRLRYSGSTSRSTFGWRWNSHD